ncbi:MAG: helix-hairpin-helix domain-containing protein [Streptococcaceae bacterium]|nr:helix-hairpin-helix domain-containing protein [Streptococcaceae bacterium]
MERIIEFIKENLKLVILSVVALFAGGIFYFVSHPKSTDSTMLATALSSVSADKTSVSTSNHFSKATEIEVDLKGAVMKPNVYDVSSDMRVDDLIKLAGGFTTNADQNKVNLAAKLKDEEVVYVPQKGEMASGVSADSSVSTDGVGNSLTTTSQTSKVNINTADLTQLQTLNGIGQKKAQDIIDYRTQNGNFQSVEDLGNVPGFGDKTIAKLKDSICVD